MSENKLTKEQRKQIAEETYKFMMIADEEQILKVTKVLSEAVMEMMGKLLKDFPGDESEEQNS